MATDLIQIDQDHPLPEAIERAAAHLRRGGIVAIPTEALYVLVADPLNLQRGRPGVRRQGPRDPAIAADADQRYFHG